MASESRKNGCFRLRVADSKLAPASLLVASSVDENLLCGNVFSFVLCHGFLRLPRLVQLRSLVGLDTGRCSVVGEVQTFDCVQLPTAYVFVEFGEWFLGSATVHGVL